MNRSRTVTESDPALSVTLARNVPASPHDAMTETLEGAVAKLSELNPDPDPHEGATRSAAKHPRRRFQSRARMKVIEQMSAAPTRREALVVLAAFLESQLNASAVRCGLGTDRLASLYDLRLGWLGPESSLHASASQQWNTPRRRQEDPPDDGPGFNRRDDVIEIRLPQNEGCGQCMVWIEAERTPNDSLDDFSSFVSAVAAVLWSRPSRYLPALALRMASRTKATVAGASILLLMLAAWPVHYRVPCSAVVDTSQQKLVATPFEATLLKSNVKPGDTVRAGEVLIELDGRPLRLEREAIQAEIQQVAKEHDVALATGRVAEAQQASLRQRKLRRKYDLLTDRLGRLEVVSPMNGVVVSGDLDKYVGSPLSRGQTLMEVAPMDAMIIEVEIPAHEIGYVEPGADVRVKIDAIGGKSIRMPLTHLFPEAELREDQNVFIGRIDVDNQDHRLRPGMRGTATTYGPLRPWIWSWVRGSIERVLWWVGY